MSTNSGNDNKVYNATTFKRMSSLVRLAAVLLVFVVPQIVKAGWPSRMGQKDIDKMQDILSGRMAIPAELSLFAKYKNKKGMRIAKKFSRNNRFTKHVKKNKLVALHVRNGTALQKLLANPNIEYVEPQHQIHALPLMRRKKKKSELNETSKVRRLEESVQYGINMVQADQLWDLPLPKEKPTICIIDSGYGLEHPDLPTLEYNITGTSTRSGKWHDDGYGHGTHCAGIIGAIGNNDIGVAGVMKDPNRFRFHIGKALNKKGDGSEEYMMDAFEGCMDAGAKVISMSFGSEDYSKTIGDMCKDAYDKGVLLVAAAGNDGETAYNYPASFPEVMSVVAVDKEKNIASFSQYNDQVEIAGPGVDILSTVTTKKGKNFGYNTWTGTSMATPYVAAVAAAVWSYFPQCTNNQIRNVLVRTAKDEKGLGCTVDLGFGIVQARDAYDLLMKEGCVAGDASPVLLSDGAIGGCSQDPEYVPPPTSAPTPFTCDEKPFVLGLRTDEWSEETSWKLQDSYNNVVGSGSGYRKNKLYFERLCLPSDEYTFKIQDSEGDGICCEYGDGRYTISYDEEMVKQGGKFKSFDVVTFGEIDEGATPGPTRTPFKSSNALLARSPAPTKTTSSTASPMPKHPTSSTLSPTSWPTIHPPQSPAPNPTATPTNSPTVSAKKMQTSTPISEPSEHPTPTQKAFTLPPYLESYYAANGGNNHFPLTPGTFDANGRTKDDLVAHFRKYHDKKGRPTSYVAAISDANDGATNDGRNQDAVSTHSNTNTNVSTNSVSHQPPANPKLSHVCRDDPTWKTTDKHERTCKDLTDKKRCEEEGRDNNGRTFLGFQSCPIVCEMCKPLQTVSGECKDDAEWTIKRGPKKRCDWIAKDPKKNCKKDGIDRGGKETLAYQSCRKSCQTCLVH